MAGLQTFDTDTVKQQLDAAAEARAANMGTFRFLLKKGDSSKIVFLDNGDKIPKVEEHFIRVDRPRNVTCPGEGCPLCAQGNKKSDVWYFTVVELKEIERQSGDPIKNPVRILGAKSRTMEYLLRQIEKRDGLRGSVFEVSRSNQQTSAAVGDLWEFEEKITKDQILELNPEAKPVNFAEELEFPTVQELTAMMNGTAQAAAKQEAPAEEVEW